MKPIEYFKQQAKNLLNDYKAKVPNRDVSNNPLAFAYNDFKIPDASLPRNIAKKSLEYQYSPRYFDIEKIFLNYNVDENNFSLMKAQHLIARMAGFEQWSILLKASDADLEKIQEIFENKSFDDIPKRQIRNVKDKRAENLEFFHIQVQNLLNDYKTKFPTFDEEGNFHLFEYKPKYFSIDQLFLDYWFDEEKEQLDIEEAQAVIAHMSEFNSWNDLLKGTEFKLEYGKILFENNVNPDESLHELSELEDYGFINSPEAKLAALKHFIAEDNYMELDYLLDRKPQYQDLPAAPKKCTSKSLDIEITSLPLSSEDRKEFIETAKSAFKYTMEQIELNNPVLMSELWDAEAYVDTFLNEKMLPISKNYAQSLIEALMIHEVSGLAVQADKVA